MQSRNYLQQYSRTKTLKELSRYIGSYQQINTRNNKLKRQFSNPNSNYTTKLNHKILSKTNKLEMSSSTLQPKSSFKHPSNKCPKNKTLKTNETSTKSFNPSKYSSNSGLKSSPKLSQYNSKLNQQKEQSSKDFEHLYVRMKTVLQENERN